MNERVEILGGNVTLHPVSSSENFIWSFSDE